MESLIAFLDLLDPDPDLEDNGDGEPALGWTLDGVSLDSGDDRELDTADDEPSLGSINCLRPDNQEQTWGACSGTTDDRERTGYACETEDEEPTLGWGADIDQRSLTQGITCDGNENEPSLGWTEMEARFGKYGWLSASNLGDEHDGREPDYPKPPKGYMHPEDLRNLMMPSLGVKGR